MKAEKMITDYSSRRYSTRIAVVDRDFFDAFEILNITDLEGRIVSDPDNSNDPKALAVFVLRPSTNKFEFIGHLNPQSDSYSYLNTFNPNGVDETCIIELAKGFPTIREITLVATFWTE